MTAFALWVLALLATSFFMWVDRERVAVEDNARTVALHSSSLLASVLDAEFGGVDKMLAGLDVAYGALGDRNPAMLDVLHHQLPLASIARSLQVIGPDGRTRYATDLEDPFAALDVSDRDYVRAHVAGTTTATFLSAPLRNDADGSWIMVVSRAMHHGSGVVAATVSIEALAKLMGSSSPAPTAAALLLDRSGVMMARWPEFDLYVGRSLADMPAFRIIQDQARGAGELISPLDGRERFFGFTACANFALTAVVTVEQREIFRQWRDRAVLPGVLLAVLVAIVVTLLVFLLRQLRSLEEAHHKLTAARLAADAANSAKSHFLANTSHELRTPLNAILGFTDALMNGLPGHVCQPRCQEYLGIVLRSGQHLLSIINDLLDLAKIEAGRMEFARDEVNVATIAGEAIAMVTEQARAKGLKLNGEGLDCSGTVVGDALRLRQIFLNLLSNAIKFTPTGGRVDVHVSAWASEVRVIVADNGIGMSEDEIAVARTPFGQVSSELARGQGGTGLGLPLVDNLVRLHGGVMEILSRKGDGTTVAVVLPRVEKN